MSQRPLTITTLAVTAGTQVFTGRCVIGSCVINAAAAASTVSVYDGTSAADQRIIFIQAGVNLSEGFMGGRVWAHNGVFVVTTGAGSETQIGIE